MNLIPTSQHFIYGLAVGNAAEARRIYHERFPDRPIPAERTFIRLHARLCETGDLSMLMLSALVDRG